MVIPPYISKRISEYYKMQGDIEKYVKQEIGNYNIIQIINERREQHQSVSYYKLIWSYLLWFFGYDPDSDQKHDELIMSEVKYLVSTIDSSFTDEEKATRYKQASDLLEKRIIKFAK
jgi:hypothetical protein